MAQFENNSKRSETRPRFDLIPKCVLEGIANRYTIGATKFGDNNWKSGGPAFFQDAKNHLMYHLLDYLEGNESEETSAANLEAVLWNAGALLWWETKGKDAWKE